MTDLVKSHAVRVSSKDDIEITLEISRDTWQKLNDWAIWRGYSGGNQAAAAYINKLILDTCVEDNPGWTEEFLDSITPK